MAVTGGEAGGEGSQQRVANPTTSMRTLLTLSPAQVRLQRALLALLLYCAPTHELVTGDFAGGRGVYGRSFFGGPSKTCVKGEVAERTLITVSFFTYLLHTFLSLSSV